MGTSYKTSVHDVVDVVVVVVVIYVRPGETPLSACFKKMKASAHRVSECNVDAAPAYGTMPVRNVPSPLSNENLERS